MGVLSLLPTQTPTTTVGVHPIVQLSRLSLVVPVFTDIVFPSTLIRLLGPKVISLALGSDKILEIIKASPVDMTLRPELVVGFHSSNTRLLPSVTFKIATGSRRIPPLAKAEYEEIMSRRGLTSPPPKPQTSRRALDYRRSALEILFPDHRPFASYF